MTGSLKKRVGLGALVTGVSQVGSIVIRFVEVPLFLAFWGTNLYGEWLVIAALPAYLTMSDMGFARATNQQMAMLVASGRRQEALSAFQSSSLLIFALSLVLSGLFVVALWGLPVETVFQIRSIARADFLWIISLLGLQIIISSQALLLFGGYYCVQRYPIGTLFLMLIRFGQFAGVVAAVFLGAEPVTVAAVMLATQAIGFIAMRVGLLRVTPWLCYGLTNVRFSVIRQLLRPALASMVFPLGQALNYQGSRLIIGAVLGPAAVVLFVAHRQLARLLYLFVTFSYPFQSELGNLFGRSDMQAFRRLARTSFQILAWVTIGAAVGEWFFGRFVFNIWVAGRIEFNQGLFLLLLAASGGEALWSIVATPIFATNQHIYIARVYMIINAILLPALYIMAKQFGMLGLTSGLFVAEGVMLWLTTRYMLAMTKDNFGLWLRAAVLAPWMFFVVLRDLTSSRLRNGRR